MPENKFPLPIKLQQLETKAAQIVASGQGVIEKTQRQIEPFLEKLAKIEQWRSNACELQGLVTDRNNLEATLSDLKTQRAGIVAQLGQHAPLELAGDPTTILQQPDEPNFEFEVPEPPNLAFTETVSPVEVPIAPIDDDYVFDMDELAEKTTPVLEGEGAREGRLEPLVAFR